MGGQSFKCPACPVWKLTKQSLHAHLKDAHKYTPGFKIVGTGPNTRVTRPEPKQRRGGCG